MKNDDKGISENDGWIWCKLCTRDLSLLQSEEKEGILLRGVKWHEFEVANAANDSYLFDYEAFIGENIYK